MSYLDNYVNVYKRVALFHEKYSELSRSITATPVPLDDGKIAVQAQLMVDGTVLSTGLSCATDLSEKKALEKAETAAIGRALSFAGFSAVGEGDASTYGSNNEVSASNDALTDAMGDTESPAAPTGAADSDPLTAAMESVGDGTKVNESPSATSTSDTESGLSPETQELLNKYGHNK